MCARCLVKTLEALNRCKARTEGERAVGVAKALKARAREYLDRGDLSNRVKGCRMDMQVALDLFNVSNGTASTVHTADLMGSHQTRLQIDQTFTMHAMALVIKELRDQQPVSSVPERFPSCR